MPTVATESDMDSIEYVRSPYNVSSKSFGFKVPIKVKQQKISVNSIQSNALIPTYFKVE